MSANLSKQVSNTVDTTLKTIEKTNKSVIDLLENPFVKYGFLIFIVLRIIFIDSLGEYYLELLDQTWVKVLYAFVVAYSACFDPVYAIALATFIIIALQELYSRRAHQAMKSTMSSNMNGKPLVLPTEGPAPAPMSVNEVGTPDKNILMTDKMIFDTINKQVLQKTPSSNDGLIAEYDYYEDPAFRTITANLNEKNYLGRNKFYATEEDLARIQNNQEPGINQSISIQAIDTRDMNIQGLPMGFDKGVGGANPELASIDSA